MRLAEEADQCSRPEEMDIPEELKRREERLVAITRAKEEIQARAQEHFEREQAEFEAKQAKREAHKKETGKKPRGKPPKPPTSGPQAKDQVNLTDEESRIMPTAGGGFEQAYNAQAGVDVKTYLIVEQHVTQHTNDKQEIEPALAAIGHLPEALGEAENLLADTGYFSEANVEKCAKASLVPFIPSSREKHNLPLTERFREDPEPPQNATAVQAMRHRLQTREGTKSRRFRRSGLCHTQIHSGNCLWHH
jgi:hypothetical protein